MAKPKLRFPEFTDEWEEKRAEELFENITIKGQENKPILAVTQDRGVLLREECGIDIKFDEKSLSNYKLVIPGNFIISLRSFQGGLELSNLEGIVSPAYTILNNIILIDKEFYKLYFKSYAFIKKLNIAVVGIRDGKQISYTSFKTIKLPNTILAEQQKIAVFFSKIDEQIANQEAVISDYEEMKKGLMQKIFSQKVRFKANGGSEYPEWEEKKLLNIGMILTGTTPSTKNKEYYSDKYLWVTPADIDGKEISNTQKKLSEAGLKKGRIIPANSVLVTCIASIGKNAILREVGSCNQQINTITPNKEYNVDFVYYLICFNENMLHANAGHGGMEILNKDQFSRLNMFFPCIEEQQKIADCLCVMDRKIEAERKILEDWKELKKALLQQMFV